MENKKTIEALNSLVTINNDRIEGYETATKQTKDAELKSLFSQFISNSQEAKRDLVIEVRSLGGEEAEGTKTSGKFFRAWMDVKAALTGNDRETILDSCEFGENEALNTYENTIENDLKNFSNHQREMVIEQMRMFKSDRDHVVALKNAL